MSNLNLPDSAKDEKDEEEFFDVVGDSNDPVKVFTKTIEGCGAITTKRDGNKIEVIDSCENLVLHKSEDYMEIFCKKCGISVSVLSVTDLKGEPVTGTTDGVDSADLEAISTNTDESAAVKDDLDELLDKQD